MTDRVLSGNAPTEALARGLLTSNQVAKASGITLRMVDYYTRRGFITPALSTRGTGTARLWDPVVVDILIDLRRRVEQCPFDHASSHRRRKPRFR